MIFLDKTYFFIIILIGVIVVISGCIDSVSESTKHFDNGVIAFDYPSNMKVVDHGSYFVTVYYGSDQILNTAGSNKTQYNDIELELKHNPNPNFIITKTTINGRTVYNITENNGNKYYFAFIDIGTGYIQVLPGFDNSVQDQKGTIYYKTYQVILNSFKVK